MKLKLRILNLKSFLQTLQTCTGLVELTLPDGRMQVYQDTSAILISS